MTSLVTISFSSRTVLHGVNFSQLLACCIPEGPAHMCGEQAVDDGVRCRVKWRQALDECRNSDVGLRLWHMSVNLQQSEHEVRTPAQNEHCNGNTWVTRDFIGLHVEQVDSAVTRLTRLESRPVNGFSWPRISLTSSIHQLN